MSKLLPPNALFIHEIEKQRLRPGLCPGPCWESPRRFPTRRSQVGRVKSLILLPSTPSASLSAIGEFGASTKAPKSSGQIDACQLRLGFGYYRVERFALAK